MAVPHEFFDLAGMPPSCTAATAFGNGVTQGILHAAPASELSKVPELLE